MQAMTPEKHLWACALEIERQHGRDAWMFATMRMQDLKADCDFEGAETWRTIRRHILTLRKGARAPTN